jgi:hypothetical protein
MSASPRLTALSSLSAILLLSACAATPPRDPAAACAALTQPIAAGSIGLPTSGATVDSATLTPASNAAAIANPPFSPTPPELI